MSRSVDLKETGCGVYVSLKSNPEAQPNARLFSIESSLVAQAVLSAASTGCFLPLQREEEPVAVSHRTLGRVAD